MNAWRSSGRAATSEQLPGHCESVDRLAFSPDGRVLATDCGHVVSMWNTASRRQLREPLGHPAHGGWGLAFSPDGRLLATVGLAPRDYSPGENYAPGGYDDIDYPAVHLWDVNGFRRVGEPLVGHVSGISDIAFRPDGRLLATAGDEGVVGLYDTATGRRLGHLGRSDYFTHVIFSADGRLVATLGDDPGVGLWEWEVASGQRRAGPEHATEWDLTDVAFSPDGRLLATADLDGLVCLWDTTGYRQLGEPLTRQTDGPAHVAFSPDSRVLATAEFDDVVRLWDASDHRQLDELPSGPTKGVAFSPDGRLLATAGYDGPVTLWDLPGHR